MESRFTHDENGRVTQVHRPDNTDIYFAWDANDNVTVLTNPADVDHAFDYNKVNLNSGYTPPLSAGYTFEFDRDRRPTKTVFPSGKTIENIYETGLNRLEAVRTPEGFIEFSYECGAKIKSVSMDSQSLTYGYDASLVTSQTLSGTLNQTLSYTYDNDFRLSGMGYAGGQAEYEYDGDGLLVEAGFFSIARDDDNGLPVGVYGDDIELTRGFNGYGELSSQETKVNGRNLLTWSVDRDKSGRITRKTETLGSAAAVFDYTYDNMGRLLTVTKDGSPVEEYQYTTSGTRLSETNALRGIDPRTFEYSAEDHLLRAGSVEYTHDADGFLTGKVSGADHTAYAYSSRGELLSVTLPDGRVIEYIHDPLGRRIAKKVNGTVTEKYLWNGLTRLLAVYDGSDTLAMRFEYADGRMPVAMEKQGTTYYLAYGQTGSLRAVADASGNVVKQIEYDSFGNVIKDTAPDFAVPFGFAGGLHDRDTGLVRFGYRDYDPDTGRWTAKDPIFFAGGDTDLYGYCLSDPVNLVDPIGLWSFWAGSSWIGALGPEGKNEGAGVAYDSENGGFGGYLTEGDSNGFGASAGFEAGFFTGSMSGKTTVFTFGLGPFSIGAVWNGEGDFGIVGGYVPPYMGLAAEVTFSYNNTEFKTFNDEPCN